ncbi:MAG: thioesterase family protein [Notoacmeibacter sp.]|nr:thioesterase family protein [Notoacmeibacter sp.]MCC0032498.1 thioesterase family protein [Brucellaceae bacterium]
MGGAPHPFDAATALEVTGPNRFAGKTSPVYANMTGPFGGVTAATFLNAVLLHPDRAGDPVAETVNFCGAIAEGEFQISCDLKRGGKYTQHWLLELTQDGETRGTASIVTGARGEVFSHHDADMPQAPAPENIDPLTMPGPLKWLDAYEFRFAEGRPEISATPFEPLRDSRSLLWIADRPARALDHLALAAFADTFLLRLLKVRGTWAPMGTVSLTTYFHATAAEIACHGSGPVLGQAVSKRMHAQFFDQHMELWAQDGTLLASGAQVAWYKA